MDTVDPDLETQQALAFIAGYAAFSAMKNLSKTSELCLDCTSFLCEDKSLDVEEIQPTFQLIQLSNRGGLNGPRSKFLVRLLHYGKYLSKYSTLLFS